MKKIDKPTQPQVELLRKLEMNGGIMSIAAIKPMPTGTYKSCSVRGWLRDVKVGGYIAMQITDSGRRAIEEQL